MVIRIKTTLDLESQALRDTAYRVILDRASTLTLAVADKRGDQDYVLRHILRRAGCYSRQSLTHSL